MPRQRTQKSPALAPARKAGPSRSDRPPTDRDRERRQLDVAARRVPAWQVSAVNALDRIYNGRPAGSDDLAMYRQLAAILASVPEVVRRAVELARTESRLR